MCRLQCARGDGVRNRDGDKTHIGSEVDASYGDVVGLSSVKTKLRSGSLVHIGTAVARQGWPS